MIRTLTPISISGTSIYGKSIKDIEKAFLRASEQKRRCVVLFFPFGFPDIGASIEILNALGDVADILEIGIPFTDPVADGALIQEAYQIALEGGASLPVFLKNLDKVKAKSVSILMSYLNPVVQAGLEQVSRKAFEAGIRGFIFPDLPVEEKLRWFNRNKKNRLPVVLLASVTDSPERISLIAGETEGFLYFVSSLGVTGLRDSIDTSFAKKFVESEANKKVRTCVGFGISKPEHIRELKRYFDGIILGSALIKIVREAGSLSVAKRNLQDFVEEVKREASVGKTASDGRHHIKPAKSG